MGENSMFQISTFAAPSHRVPPVFVYPVKPSPVWMDAPLITVRFKSKFVRSKD